MVSRSPSHPPCDERSLHDAEGTILTPLHLSSILLIIPDNTASLLKGSSLTVSTSQRSRSGAHPSISLTPSLVTRADYSSRGPDRSSSTMRHRYRTSNTSFKKNVDMQHSHTTKSRLMDIVSPPSPYPSQDEISMSGKFKLGILKAGMLKSGLLGTEEDNDDDPLFDEDIPDRFNKEHLGTSTILEWVNLITILIFFICSILIPY